MFVGDTYVRTDPQLALSKDLLLHPSLAAPSTNLHSDFALFRPFSQRKHVYSPFTLADFSDARAFMRVCILAVGVADPYRCRQKFVAHLGWLQSSSSSS